MGFRETASANQRVSPSKMGKKKERASATTLPTPVSVQEPYHSQHDRTPRIATGRKVRE